MQRSKGQQSAKRFQELGRNLLGLLAISSPVHKAMTDRGDAYMFPPVELGQNLASGRTVIWKRGAMVQDGIFRGLSDPQAPSACPIPSAAPRASRPPEFLSNWYTANLREEESLLMARTA